MGTQDEFFTEPRAVVGACVAGRTWRVWPDGVLTGVSYWQEWAVRGNVAHCPYVGQEPTRLRSSIPHPESWRGGVGVGFISHGPSTARRHKPGALGCSCGWWAYHDLTLSASWAMKSTANKVVGVVQVYGLMTRGTKGYRSQFADILALVTPDWSDLEDGTSPELWERVAARYPVPCFPSIEEASAAVYLGSIQ